MAMTVRVHRYGAQPILEETPEPTVGFGEVRVRVIGCGVNPADWKRAAGDFAHFIPDRFPISLGAEFSGEIVTVGASVEQHAVGDRVFGMTSSMSGAYSTSLVVSASDVCALPEAVSHHEGCGVPVCALTAYQALHEQARIHARQRVLVHGAAGGVGGFAVQLARLAGAEVLGTASASNGGYVLELGASRCIDYERERFEDVVGNVDVVIDTVGGDVERRSWTVLKPDGCLVSLNPPPPGRADARERRGVFFRVRPDRGQLRLMAEMIASGQLRVHVGAVFPLAQAARAMELSRTRHLRGKIVLEARAGACIAG